MVYANRNFSQQEAGLAQSIKILVGSMTGTAEMVAEDIIAMIDDDADHETEMVLMDDLGADAFSTDHIYLIVTSTYGQGEVPDNAVDFFEALEDERPDLSGISYGVFGLGDSTYNDTFNHGGKKFDDLLASLGAKRIGDRAEHNANGPSLAEDAGVEWARDWLKLLPEAAEA